MKKWLIPVGIIVVLGFIIYSMTAGFYNNAIELKNNAETAWTNVESSYQRRNDMIDNLVKTDKGEADYKRRTLNEVIKARAKATSINVDADNLSPAQLQQFQEAQSQVSSALSRLLVTVERYPQLTATQSFRDLQAQLEGTENRINVARNRYNEAVNAFNTKIQKFPNNLFAGMFGFEKMTRFQAD